MFGSGDAAPAIIEVPEDPPGVIRYEGTVSSFSQQTAWGFITCPDLQTVYGKDIFFHLKDCGGAVISKGQKVSFLLADQQDPNGKPRASSVRGTQHSPDPPGSIRYTGVVHSFSTQSAWGFISCPDLQPVLGKDVFVHLKDCGGAAITKGQTVTFLLDENSTPGKPQARSVQVPGQPAGGANMPRLSGTVTSYSEASAWGFITCPEVNQVYGKDTFFHLKDCHGATMANGVPVTFVLDQESADQGKPRACDVQVVRSGGGCLVRAPGIAYQTAAGPTRPPSPVMLQQPQVVQPQVVQPQVVLPQVVQPQVVLPQVQLQQPQLQQQPQLLQAAAGMTGDDALRAILQQAVAGTGVQLEGSIQSFSEQAGWGFIESATLGHSGGKGIFFHIKDCAGFAASPERGFPVVFTVGQGPSGKQQAKNVMPGGNKRSPEQQPVVVGSEAFGFGGPALAGGCGSAKRPRIL